MFTNLHPFAQFPAPPRAYVFWDDFDDELALTSNLPVAASSGWIGATKGSGTVSFATDEEYGVAVLSGQATTDNSSAQMIRDMETAGLIAGKTTRFLSRFKLSDATNSHSFAGLTLTDSTILDGADGIAGLTASDCVGFFKPDDGASIDLVVVRDSVVTCRSTVATLADATYYWFAFEVQMDPTTAGKGMARGWVFNSNGVLVGQSGPVSSVTMPYSTEEILCPAVAMVSGNNTGTKTMTVDAIGMMIDR